jgi:hypothetical protein
MVQIQTNPKDWPFASELSLRAGSQQAKRLGTACV